MDNQLFDLMKEKPELDIPTLNYMWDTLCRFNMFTPKNEKQREDKKERARIMEYIESVARMTLLERKI